MTSPLSNSLSSSADLNALASDARSLDALKREARDDPHAAVKKAAKQFEALFMQMVLKSMRDATMKSDLMSGGSGEDMATSMFDQQLATQMSASGTGLADVLTRQLTQHLDRVKPASAVGAPNESSSEPSSIAPTSLPVRADARVQRYAATARLGETEIAAPVAKPGGPAQQSFVQKHWDSAAQAQRMTGVPAGFIVSQAALESGWGKGEIRHADGSPSHNLFGIKAGAGWQGRTVDVVTTEYENGQPKKVTEKFRAYANYEEAFSDWAQLMARNPRYAGVLQSGGNAREFADALQKAGYATDPNYAAKLASVIGTVHASRTTPVSSSTA